MMSGGLLVASLLLGAPGPKPKVVLRLQIFVDPSGYLTRRYGARSLQKAEKAALKTLADVLVDPGVELSRQYVVKIKRAQFHDYTSKMEDVGAHLTGDTLLAGADYLVDVVIGETQRGLKAVAWLINLKTQGAPYRIAEAEMTRQEIGEYLPVALIHLAKTLGELFLTVEAEDELLSQIIDKTETPVELQVQPSKEVASLSHDETITITVSNIRNIYGNEIYRYIGDQLRVAMRLKEGSPGMIVSGAGDEKSPWRVMEAGRGAVNFVYKLPLPDAFTHNPLEVEVEVKPVSPRTGEVLADAPLSLLSGSKTSFQVAASYAWHLKATWNLSSKNTHLQYAVEADLHSAQSCMDYLVREGFFSGAMRVQNALWYSDNFVLAPGQKAKDGGRVTAFKYTDCGALDPWRMVDPTIDTLYIVALPKGGDLENFQEYQLCFYFSGASAVNNLDDTVDMFDIFRFRLVGAEVLKGTKFEELTAKVAWTVDIPRDLLDGSQAFSRTIHMSHEFNNQDCGMEDVDVSITLEFTPIYELQCIPTREEYLRKKGKLPKGGEGQ